MIVLVKIQVRWEETQIKNVFDLYKTHLGESDDSKYGNDANEGRSVVANSRKAIVVVHRQFTMVKMELSVRTLTYFFLNAYLFSDCHLQLQLKLKDTIQNHFKMSA